METTHNGFNTEKVLHKLRHYLPAQAPLKDFIHHNTLHAFQHYPFYTGIQKASEIFGYKVTLNLRDYRAFYETKRISNAILEKVISTRKGADQIATWKERLLHKKYKETDIPRVGRLRSNWKKQYQIDLDSMVQPILYRTICSYLDQGISIWNFPVWNEGFLASIKELEKHSFSSFFKTERAKNILLNTSCSIKDLLYILVGNESLYEQYLYDQQFAHQGWSGMVASIEDNPQSLLDTKKITLHDIIVFELLLEIDALDAQFGTIWAPLAFKFNQDIVPLFNPIPETELDQVLMIWQDAFEWTYYDDVLAAIQTQPKPVPQENTGRSFQALFCIDDRECSIRRYVEKTDKQAETYGTPGFFGVEFFFKPINGKFTTKLCPAPVTPKYLIKEEGSASKLETDMHFTSHSHSLFRGWLISQTLGFWSALKLFFNIFRPTMSPATASSIKHMDKNAKLTIENKNLSDMEDGLQVGFTIDEMTTRVEELLRSIGLIHHFAPIIYIVGHGASSVNNPHYSAYDCGACSGRAGSVNARVICFMANHPGARKKLAEKGIIIPNETQFVGALHDTTRDDITFYDEESLNEQNKIAHKKNEVTFYTALDLNAKERSRRFESIDSSNTPKKIHEKIRIRSVSLFEPRPELNHATNALCIVGQRDFTKHVFLDRRSFLNSYDYKTDPTGTYLFNILKAAAPVCGGINLEYYFSRVDNQKLGAGTKLPHNVMGLFGVANGIDGDLRPGLPSQMIEVHDPVRLLIIVEHFPEVVEQTIQHAPETYEWFKNEWVHLVVCHPETREFFVWSDEAFHPYYPITKNIPETNDITQILEKNSENIPVYILNETSI